MSGGRRGKEGEVKEGQDEDGGRDGGEGGDPQAEGHGTQEPVGE